MVTLSDLPSPSAAYAAYASVSASVMLVRTTFHQVVPRQVQDFLVKALFRIFKRTNTSLLTLVVDQFDGMSRNDLFDSFEIYMSTKTNPNTQRLKITKRSKDKHVTVRLAQSENIIEFFQGIKIKWKFVCEESENVGGKNNSRNSSKYPDDYGNRPRDYKTKLWFELRFEKEHKETVINSYIPFVLEKTKAIQNEKKVVKLHTLGNKALYSESPVWDSINLEHPSTFEKLAMEPSEKKGLMDDLDLFVQRKEYYKKVGRAWKRGYLLYGPPGTGKSSLIAAMANYLKFDIYDLQLMNVKHDAGLRKLLLGTANRSILVIEDIDCSVELPDRNTKTVPSERQPRDLQFTLSGLLNFIDGLWSSCGDERIIIFTTNNKDKLDPALLRPGRMDKHIHMSYLSVNGFKTLASNYLDIKDQHWRYGEIEELLGSIDVTPAEVAEELMKTSDADECLGGLVNFLKGKKRGRSVETKDPEDSSDEIQQIPEAKRIKANGWQ
ncbi:Protein hyper-sensitivity-related 4 [Heracleum sosnowskyi]|uniref:Protein hyper-sensitivity-related 4 n=1 Tax=Heracleum sosnowskyi TaxID=360622 RepID=A0AAD8HW78_9APIA|nr:Protein hyper-sensitivity-related 4 [Heracleum sosnowskyi]